MAYYSTHGTSQFLLNNEKQRVRFVLAHPVHILSISVKHVSGKPYFECKFLNVSE